jgi:hypothetical protein
MPGFVSGCGIVLGSAFVKKAGSGSAYNECRTETLDIDEKMIVKIAENTQFTKIKGQRYRYDINTMLSATVFSISLTQKKLVGPSKGIQISFYEANMASAHQIDSDRSFLLVLI